MKHSLGILGGMGPMVSAEFLRSIYRCCMGEDEQSASVCCVLSDPSFPDRTRAILNGQSDRLIKPLVGGLRRLRRMGADRIVITCVTLHYVLPAVPLELRQRVISLLDITVDLLKRWPGNALLLCTEGTRRTQLFERHPSWDQVRHRVVLPSPKDQRKIHQLIYDSLKRNRFSDADEQHLRQLAAKYEVRAFIAGCTEFHLLHERFTGPAKESEKIYLIDPLIHLARNLEAYLRR